MRYCQLGVSGMSHPAGESRGDSVQLNFDRRLKLEFHGSKITSDAGLRAYRELDEALGLTPAAGAALSDLRRGRNRHHVLTGLLRQSVYSRLAGYEDVDDAERLAVDPAMRAIVDRRGLAGAAASISQMGRFETAWLTYETNLAALSDLAGCWIDRVYARKPRKMIILDMDSAESPTHGRQEGSAYNGHFGCTCYHPLFCFNQFGDLERSLLRRGNVHSAEDWRTVLAPVVARYRERRLRRYFRADAAFAMPEIYTFLEAEGFRYTIRLPANRILTAADRSSAAAPGRSSSEGRSARLRQLPLSGEELDHTPPGRRKGRVASGRERVVAFYNRRGTAEQWIKEGKNAIAWTRLSCHGFTANAVRLQLHTLAYNLANFMRTLALPQSVEHWSLTTLRDKLIKIGGKVVRHGRCITFQLAEVAVPRTLFAEILRLIDGLPPRPVPTW